MKLMKSIVLSCLLVMAFAITGMAQTVVTQIPTTCTTNTIYQLLPPAGAYAPTVPAGLYVCYGGNTFVSYGGAGGSTQVLLSNYTNATATASAIQTFPLLASTNYQYSCALFWQNSGTGAGITLTLVTPSSPTSTIAFAQIIYNATGGSNTAPLTGSPLALTSTAAGAGATTYKALLDGTIQNVTAGNLVFEGSTASGTVTVLNGSYCSVKSVP